MAPAAGWQLLLFYWPDLIAFIGVEAVGLSGSLSCRHGCLPCFSNRPAYAEYRRVDTLRQPPRRLAAGVSKYSAAE